MRIRPETPADHAAIREINIAAFADHPFSRQTEHLIVEVLRAAGALTLSLVAEDGDGVVVGHIAFSRAPIDGQDQGWHLLGPVAVLPALQRGGIGKALVHTGLDALRALGSQGCVLVGDPGYYTRLGFRQAASLVYPGVPPEVVLCSPLAGVEPSGLVGHHPAFDVQP
ncbi:MAG: GNAT family N-acetyltransferase [Desulfovibrionales bacterium GWA2_65_9]|nr:MAG: GNAT family N-acetyltransferase [Desulfovibrionales bacterium GWA2_65_9]